ncbi:MAG TPA: DUF4142 domain-containing protein [Steroidobacteraceae bacterium]
MKRILAMAIVAVPLIAFAADKSSDQTFFKKAAEGGIAEVEAGKLAQNKGDSQAVKDFGSMMVKDHTAANDKLKSIADAENITLPTSPSVLQRAGKAKLEAMSGDSFDKAYIKNQISAHRQTIALFRKEIASGTDAQAKAFATDTLPTLQGHLKKIRQIASEAGVSTK